MKKPKSISAEELDRLFDEGVDISDYIDYPRGRFVYSPEARAKMLAERAAPAELHLSPATLTRLKEIAQDRGCTPSEVVESLVRDRFGAETGA